MNCLVQYAAGTEYLQALNICAQWHAAVARSIGWEYFAFREERQGHSVKPGVLKHLADNLQDGDGVAYLDVDALIVKPMEFAECLRHAWPVAMCRAREGVANTGQGTHNAGVIIMRVNAAVRCWLQDTIRELPAHRNVDQPAFCTAGKGLICDLPQQFNAYEAGRKTVLHKDAIVRAFHQQAANLLQATTLARSLINEATKAQPASG